MSTFDPKLPVKTRDGREVEVLDTDSIYAIGSAIYPIFAKVKNWYNNWSYYHFTIEGFWDHTNPNSPDDLINVAAHDTTPAWVNQFAAKITAKGD